MAGYGKTARVETPPVEDVQEPSTEQDVTHPAIEADHQEPSMKDLASELKALKAKVAESGALPDEMRRMYGEIGNINRTLQQQVKAAPAAAPVDDEFTAALKEAEAVAGDFPELMSPILKALKAARQPTQQPTGDIDDRVTQAVTSIRQREAIETLQEEHPDYITVRDTAEYKTWLASKTPEFQERFTTTWNPAVVSRGLSEFKESLKTRERKQTRLAAAIAPQGVQQRAGPSTLSDDDGFSVGYNKVRKR
jgi:hypothetical protein